VSEDKDQRELFKKNQKQLVREGIMSKLGQKDGMKLGKRRLTALGHQVGATGQTIVFQSFITQQHHITQQFSHMQQCSK
jgi:hypothetical protein